MVNTNAYTCIQLHGLDARKLEDLITEYYQRGGARYRKVRQETIHILYAGLLKMLQHLKHLNHNDWHYIQKDQCTTLL